MYCPNCGKEVSGKFCSDCGAEIKIDSGASETTANLELHSEVKSEVIIDTLEPKKKTSAGRIIAWVASILLFFFGLIGQCSATRAIHRG